ncbi:unnamed protein product [Angiostrongylus costaricensis]|uniref:Fibronectin type-III domain-containing protein n=1 Tax=Angiostrongylus costaricensis TaxID=334426 RepID=A0A3P7HSZ5_ANGCS|nr:unnamed protein product [Angiostrongylus costaricensis]
MYIQVDTAGTHAQFSLQVANVTEDTTFNCVAQNPLGQANWTIRVNLLPGLDPEWKDDFVTSKSENGEVVLVFSDNLPDYLKPPNEWIIRYTDDPRKPKNEWKVVPSDSAPLTRITVPDMEPGTYYYLVVDSPDKGIQTPTLLVMTPKPPSDIRVGTNINDETIVDFKPAITSQPLKKYTIKVWKLSDPSNIKHYESDTDVPRGVVLDGLDPDTEYAVVVAAEFFEGDILPSEPVTVRTPPGGVACDCAHACTFEEDKEGAIIPKCYCHTGFVLGEDQKSCVPSADTPTSYTIVRVTPPSFTTDVQPEEISLTTSKTFIDDETSAGGLVGPDASPLPTTADGTVLMVKEPKSTVRPTDSSGRELPLVVGPDGIPLDINAEGQIVDMNQNPIIIDDEGAPLDPFGNRLPQNKQGVWIYPLIDKSGNPLPVDENNMPIISIIDTHGREIPVGEDGNIVDSNGRIIKTDAIGRPLDKNGQPYPINEDGFFVVGPIEETVREESQGKPHMPLLTVDGEPIPTDTSGNYVTTDGTIVEKDGKGRPLGPDGHVLPTDATGNYIYPALGSDRRLLPTDINRRPIHPILGPDGSPLPTDKSGRPLGKNGEPIPTNAAGTPLDNQGEPLPTDSNGNFVTIREELPTDESGHIIYPVTRPDGSPLPTDASGSFITDEGTIVEKDDEGRPIGPDGHVLPTDERGNYIYPVIGPNGSPLPTDIHKRPIYPVVGKSGSPLPTDVYGAYIDADGRPIPTDTSGKPVGQDGSPLPTDHSGNYITGPFEKTMTKMLPTDESGNLIYPVTKPGGSPLPTDASGNFVTDEGIIVGKDEEGRPLGPDGQVLPTDEIGNYIYPAVGPDGRPLPTDIYRRPIHPVLGPDGSPLPTDESSRPLSDDGEPIPTDAAGTPLDNQGRPLPTDNSGNFIAIGREEGVSKELPTDVSGNTIYPVTRPDGSPLPTDISGNSVTDEGRVIERDDEGRPLGPDGQVLPTDETGNYIYPIVGPDGRPLPTDIYRRPIHPVLGRDGSSLPTDESGHPLSGDGEPIPTNAAGTPLDSQGQPLPTDSSGNYIITLEEEGVSKQLPTDESGNVIYPVTRPDGSLLPTDASGNFLTDEGMLVDRDEEGRPLGSDGQVLPTDEVGNYIYPAIGPDGSPLPTDFHKRPIYPVVGKDGSPLPTDGSGAYIDSDGRPIPTDASGKPVGQDGSPLPTDAFGNYVGGPLEKTIIEAPPTDYSGNVVYPVTKPDGSPLPTDASGNFLTDEGTIVEKDDEGRPLGPDGQVLPTDGAGNYIYSTGADLSLSTTGFTLHPYPGGEVLVFTSEALHCSPGDLPTETLLFIVESSHKSGPYLQAIKALLKSFVQSLPKKGMPKIGKLIYAATTEVTIDIGHYRNKEELITSFDEIREIGGSPDADLALNIALQLLLEEERGPAVVLHFHLTPLRLAFFPTISSCLLLQARFQACRF